MRESNIHKNVLALPVKHRFSVVNVLSWIKTQQEVIKQARSDARRLTGAKSLQSRAKALNADAYIRDMRRYLRTGVWVNGSMNRICYGEFEDQWANGSCFEAPDPRPRKK